MKSKSVGTRRVLLAALAALAAASSASAQETNGRALLERAAEAMGGLQRLQALDNFVLTGFGLHINQTGGSSPSAHPRAPTKWQAAHDVERIFDLRNGRALNQDRRAFMFPFAAAFGQSWERRGTLQTGVAMLDHPLPALLAALAPATDVGAVHVEDGLPVVQLTLEDATSLWLAFDPRTYLPSGCAGSAPATRWAT